MTLATEQTARQRQAEAERLAAEAAAAKEAQRHAEQAARDAAKEAEEARKEAERERRGWILNAGNRVRDLRERVQAGLKAAPAETGRPDARTRSQARFTLRHWPEGPSETFATMDLLGRLDGRIGALYGLQAECQAAMVELGEAGVNDEALATAIDAAECECHRALLARLAWLAGETE